jgi:Na+/melibiose symporter-like transporter
MFRGLINDATAAAGAVVAKYAARASVAVPFIAALGFVTAGITLMLVERFGHRNAYFMVAGGFTAIGFLAALIVGAKEHEELVANAQSAKADTADVATDATAAAAAQIPLALLGALFSSAAGPSSLLGTARLLGRNLPLVVMLVALGVLFWPNSTEEISNNDRVEPEPMQPNGHYRQDAPLHETRSL